MTLPALSSSQAETADAWARYCAVLAKIDGRVWHLGDVRHLIDAFADWARLWDPEHADELIAVRRRTALAQL
jgi:hypothetical protein